LDLDLKSIYKIVKYRERMGQTDIQGRQTGQTDRTDRQERQTGQTDRTDRQDRVILLNQA
jgi:hypothetical protein